MNEFKLSNLRELSVEEQKQLSGGQALCDADCGTCTCTCKCTKDDPSKSTGEDFAATGANAQMGRKEREAMVK